MEFGVDRGEDKPESTAVGETHSNEGRSEDPVIGYDFDDEIFGISRQRAKLTRRQKWIDRRQYVGEPEAEAESWLNRHALEVTSGELADMQEADETLVAVNKAAEGTPSTAGGGFFKRGGVVYRWWTPPGSDAEEMAVEQMVLPKQCRKTVLHLAHAIPLAGHMGRDKTTRQILQQLLLAHCLQGHCRLLQKLCRVPEVP